MTTCIIDIKQKLLTSSHPYKPGKKSVISGVQSVHSMCKKKILKRCENMKMNIE